tara:strand:- start:339368 stop:341683 length:2316 start_codon:yes stop_codon:yes gene_type:complete
MDSRFRRCLFLLLLPILLGNLPPKFTRGDEPSESETTPAGHSYHGEAFNEGPRQAAVLIDGLADIRFPTSAKTDKAQAFIEQGIAQLHGFWYLEAERSFRQAAKLEPELAIAYWGMAMANVNNADRAQGLIDEAMQLRAKNTSRREKLYIEAFDRYLAGSDGDGDAKDKKEAKKDRAIRLIADLEKIVHDFPDDIEARVQIALQLWLAERTGAKIASRYAVDALLGDVFAEQPNHPAHHYRIHLWDSQRPENALESAALCGPSMPAVAHMWHMPGHIYSKLHRYADAAWQQEASARVDHAHMNRARLMPDQIHNFAHNNEWLTRNLLYLGRVDDALDQAKNLVSLPRHPAYNSIDKRGSFKYGRMRLLQTLTEYELWDQLIDEAGGPFFPPTKKAEEQEEWLGWLAVAHFRTGNPSRGAKTMRSLQRRRLKLQSKLLDLADGKLKDQATDENGADADDETPTKENIRSHLDALRKVIARVAACAATHRNDAAALQRHAKVAKLDQVILATWLADAGDFDAAIKTAQQSVKQGKGQVRPTAILVDLLWQRDNKESNDKQAAQKNFEKLRSLASHADIETPILARLTPVAEASGLTGDWRKPAAAADDLGQRPPLDSLGPFRWQPYTAPSWRAQMSDGTEVHSFEYEGRPRLLIFYLGFGCLHCIEQLHAFSPRAAEFDAAGIDLVAISTESVDQLKTGMKDYEKPIAIPLLADPTHESFQQFRCWDDFEDQPLHGTFLIDARGRVRWQDISHEPFTDVDFMLDEAKRLLELP